MRREVLWIIDGNNVIRRLPHLAELAESQGMEAACRFLESALSAFRARQGRGHSVVVAYDRVDGVSVQRGKGLRILTASRGGDADRIVLDEARRAEGRMEVNVVSSDRKDITNRLRGLRVKVHSAESFAPQILPKGGSAPTEVQEDKPKSPSAKEVDMWLEEFGFDGEEGFLE